MTGPHDVFESREEQKPDLHFVDDITRVRLEFLMKTSLRLVVITALTLFSCAGPRLAHDEARRKIAELGRSELVPDAIEIRRLVLQGENEVIAESSVTLAFQFKRDPAGGEWRVAAVRMGDRDWIDVNELMAAIEQARQRETTAALGKVVTGISEYRRTNNVLPSATDIVALTNVLHPQYMTDLIRNDAWGNAIEYEVAGSTFRLVSKGADGVRGTADDIVLP
jgi:hypothetical protein